MKKTSHIKTFVLRQGHMSQAQKTAISTLWPSYGLHPKDKTIDFNEVFKNKNLVSLEIGFGNGDTLISLAQRHPEKNFIGIEVHKPGIGSLLLKLEKYQLKNVKVFCADAIEILKNVIPDQSLSDIYLLFPDPWPKKKHHKRRIVQPEFIKLIEKKLSKNGKFHLATDWEDYAHQMQAVISQDPNFKPAKASCVQKERPTTKFEARGEKLGHAIWDYLFEKQDTNPNPALSHSITK